MDSWVGILETEARAPASRPGAVDPPASLAELGGRRLRPGRSAWDGRVPNVLSHCCTSALLRDMAQAAHGGPRLDDLSRSTLLSWAPSPVLLDHLALGCWLGCLEIEA